MANKLKLIPKAQKGASMVVPSNLDMNTLLANSWKKMRDQAMLAQQEYTPAGDATIQQAVNFIGRQAPAAAPTTPTAQTIATAKGNGNLLDALKFVAPKFAELKGTDAAPIQARPGGNQENDIQREARLRAQNSELGRFFTH